MYEWSWLKGLSQVSRPKGPALVPGLQNWNRPAEWLWFELGIFKGKKASWSHPCHTLKYWHFCLLSASLSESHFKKRFLVLIELTVPREMPKMVSEMRSCHFRWSVISGRETYFFTKSQPFLQKFKLAFFIHSLGHLRPGTHARSHRLKHKSHCFATNWAAKMSKKRPKRFRFVFLAFARAIKSLNKDRPGQARPEVKLSSCPDPFQVRHEQKKLCWL